MTDLMRHIADLSQDRCKLAERLFRQPGTIASISPRSETKDIPLSFAQEQLWFLDQFQPGNPSYHIAASMRFRGALDPVSLEQALRTIVARHDILRTSFVTLDGKPVQVIAPIVTLEDVPLVDLRPLPEGETEEKSHELAVQEARQPFDLAHGPLLRVKLLGLSDEEHVLILVVHHIVADGWSMRVLLCELLQLYEAFVAGQQVSLPKLTIRFADYASWQRSSQQREVFERQLDYWKDRLAGDPSTLDLPTDRPRPATQTFHGSQHAFHLPATIVEQLRELGKDRKSVV